MKSFSIINRRARAVFAAALIVFGAMVPALVSAATVTSRSIALSSSVKATTNVTYNVKFTSPTNTTDFVLDFCDNAAIGTACTTAAGAAGLDVASVGTSTSGYTVSDLDSNTAVVTLGTPGTSIDVELTGIVNPTNAGVAYARITTYAGTHDYVDANTLGTVAHDGGVAINITDGFGVSGRVAESMVFCASGSASTIGTGCSTNVTSPNITLGTGGVLSSTLLSEGTIKTQISTNALGGAVVYLKSDAAGCGGLLREGTGTAAQRCGISPLTVAGAINAGDPKFGLKLGNLGGASSTTTALSGSYSTTNYFFNYDTDNNNSEGVTGPYGDPIFNTSGAPVSDGTADLTFGASISSITPAGNYKASYNLIATGTF